MWFKVTDQLNERWQSDWILQAFWQVLNGGILAVICYLWAPTHNATRSVVNVQSGPAALCFAVILLLAELLSLRSVWKTIALAC